MIIKIKRFINQWIIDYKTRKSLKEQMANWEQDCYFSLLKGEDSYVQFVNGMFTMASEEYEELSYKLFGVFASIF
jgi:hypothetical protein